MREHNVARGEITVRHKAPTNFGPARNVDLMHVRRGAAVDAVTLFAIAADDVKVSLGIELSALLGRQPGSQKALATTLAIIFTRKYPG